MANKERFFYTTHYPYRWSNGPGIHLHDPETWAEIKSLEEAKELAEKYKVDSTHDDCVTTTYGVMYV